MDIQKKKVPKDKAWSVATKTAAMAALGLTAGLGLGACSKEEPEPIIFGDVGTDLTVSMQVKSPDSTKADSICVRDSVKTDSSASAPQVRKKKRKVAAATRGVPSGPDGDE
ncbi:MAG: hypothetical protein MJZ05_09515 [Fibrobacter sp.]|nr:hypothetical protein [Fibrobacter sp.]